ncbi:MAG: VWA domain-containing protein [SAR202 cluster bacterium]|nr:VWA domain-containing protein [SAR202 cluster bacterium]
MIRVLKGFLAGQRGYAALTLGLIGLMFTTLLLVPYLIHVQTSLLAVRKAGDGLRGGACGAAGVEYTLWKLQYEAGFVDSLTPENPTVSYDVPCDSYMVPVTVTLASQPSNLPGYLTEYAFADISLVIDVSSSISSSEMTVFKDGANAIVDGFNLDVNSERYRIGLTKFGRFSRPVVDVANSDDHLHAGINGLTSTSLFTCLANYYYYNYALRGNSATTFWQYDIPNDQWNTKASTPATVGDGGGLAFDGTYVYALRGAATSTFWRYNLTANTWTAMANTPASVSTGGALLYAGSYIYALLGNNGTGFYRYDITNNTWSSMSAAPAAVGAGGVGGGALVYNGTHIYALRGANTTTFWRYDIAGNSWTSMAASPAAIGDGGALVYNGANIYALRGNNSTTFYRYNIGADTWTTLAAAPSAVGTGGAGGGGLAFDGTYIYAVRGTAQTTHWRYDIAANTWAARVAAPSAISDGGALVHTGYFIACETNLVAGLTGGTAQYNTGLGDRPGIPNLMVFLTDGDDNSGNSLTDIENASTASGARIFAVGIDDISINSLNAIASEPDEDHVFYATDFNAFLDLIDEIVAAVTQGGLAGSLYDIEVTAPDGSVIRVRVLLTVDGNVVVISSQEV